MKGQPSRLRLATVLCAVAVVAAACGSAHTRDELIAATSGTRQASDVVAPGAERSGGGSSAATPTTVAVDPGGSGGTVTDGTPTGGTAPDAAGGSTGGTGGTTGGGSAVQCTGREPTLNIGTIGEQSGVFGPFMAPITQGVQLWVKAANAAGGVNCHKIQLIVKDDGGDPSVHQSQVQELVEQRNVVALVGTTAVLTGNASVRYLEAKGVPVIGNEGGSEWTYESPVYFPQIITGNTALGALVAAIAKVGQPMGKTRFGTVTCLEAALCSALYGDAPALTQKAGIPLAYRAQASLTQPDFTSNCQAAKDAGVELFLIGLDTNSIQRVLRNCESIGFKPLYITGGPLVTPALLADPRAEGFYFGPGTNLAANSDSPGVAEYLAAQKRFAPGTPVSTSAMAGWAAGKLFEAGLRGATEPTRAALLASMYTIKGNDLDGLTYPLTFSAGKPPPRVACLWIAVVKSKQLVPGTDGGGRFCA